MNTDLFLEMRYKMTDWSSREPVVFCCMNCVGIVVWFGVFLVGFLFSFLRMCWNAKSIVDFETCLAYRMHSHFHKSKYMVIFFFMVVLVAESVISSLFAPIVPIVWVVIIRK